MTGPGYWGYYPPAKPKQVKDGIKARSKRGSIGEKWWSKRWVDVLESFNIGARLGRGRSYARKGQVVSIDVDKGTVRSRVQGTRTAPYNIRIELKPLSDGEWDKVILAMVAKASFSARLLSGEMPSDIEEAFRDAGVSLFPKHKKDLKTSCSCPDWSNPCKHIAAVYYLLAEQFDSDPFLIFRLRGRTREEIIQALRDRRATGAGDGEMVGQSTIAPEDGVRLLQDCLDSFWRADSELDSLVLDPAEGPQVENAVMKRLGDSPFFIGKDNLTLLLSRAYGIASGAARQKASGETDEPEEKRF